MVYVRPVEGTHMPKLDWCDGPSPCSKGWQMASGESSKVRPASTAMASSYPKGQQYLGTVTQSKPRAPPPRPAPPCPALYCQPLLCPLNFTPALP